MNKRYEELVKQVYAVLDLLKQRQAAYVMVGGETKNAKIADPWVNCRKLLDTVVLPADEHSWICLRLDNGFRYFLHGENGAAGFEVGLVLKRIRRMQNLYA